MKQNQPDNPFAQLLRDQGLVLARSAPRVIQINVGLICDLACRHCHLEAGPKRSEIMTRTTMDQVVALVQRTGPEMVDITGGAPELVPDLEYLLRQLSATTQRVMLRSNLTALADSAQQKLLELCVEKRIVLVVSFPSLSASQADSQRGGGVHEQSLEMLRRLNRLGYGQIDSGLELNLVSNPSGAFLPVDQLAQERRFKKNLERRWGIVFNHLFTFANMPLGRFRKWLESSANYESYLGQLKARFNPDTLSGLMCRNLVSISWDGYLYDCDFNQAADICLGSYKTHVTEVDRLPVEGETIATGEHCFACTAGSGFT